MAAHALAVFTGAFLLFQVQPLMGKYLLPWFGGAPGVWTGCLLFFQVMLLAGYAYAHLSVRWLKPRPQVVLHLGLLALAIACLPIAPNPSWKPQPEAAPILQLLLVLTRSVGLPYFVLAATAPLLQHWSGQTNPKDSPFRLYALSNAASFLALLSYPTLFEAQLTRSTQTMVWSAGLCLYAVMCAWSGMRVWKSNSQKNPVPNREVFARPSAGDKFFWVALPACASLVLMAITNAVCQDIAAIPLLWVIPLALYLLSFTLCFADPRCYSRLWFGLILFGLLPAMGALRSGSLLVSSPLQITIFSAGLFVACMVCHGEVYRLRPDPAYLTSFYLSITAGGAIGGVFVAVIAPLIFTEYLELDWGLILCGALFLFSGLRTRNRNTLGRLAILGSSAGWIVLAVLAFLVVQSGHQNDAIRVARMRNFYGVLRVFRHQFPDPTLNLIELVHGRVAHGLQFLHPQRSKLPTLYYTPQSGVGRALAAIPAGRRRIGVVGLGAGTLAAYAQAGDHIHFYEINPQVIELAKTQFTYLQKATGQATVVLGDARISLENEPAQDFDLLALDAFNSDSIPFHLLTREAFQVYQRHLSANGVLAVNISNRSLDLEPVIASLAQVSGFQASVVHDPETDELHGILPSTWVLLYRNPQFAQQLPIRQNARTLAVAGVSLKTLWTDDYSSLFSIVRWTDNSGSSTMATARTFPVNKNTTPAQSRVAADILRFREAVNRDPNSPVALNNLACLLATAGDPALRDGGEAVRLAERACGLTGYQNTSVLSTLAAAYAENGRFEEAVATAEKACSMAEARGETKLLEGNQRMLQLYRQKQAYHLPAPRSAGF